MIIDKKMELVLSDLKSKTEEAFHDEIRSVRLKSDSDVTLCSFLCGFLRHLLEKMCECFCISRNKTD